MLISDEYKALLRRTHAESPGWGTTAYKHVDKLKEILAAYGRGMTWRILDYGCGKGSLKDSLPEHEVTEFDPGIPGKDRLPGVPVDLAVCIDVMEHVEPDSIFDVLNYLYIVAGRTYLVIDTVPAKKVLPDGRNAHLAVRSAAWWEEALQTFWRDVEILENDGRRVRFLCGT
jgi:hypothetical protein